MSFDQLLKHKLDTRRENDSFRVLRGNNLKFDFCSNDYLGLSTNPHLLAVIEEEYAKTSQAIGSGGSRLLAGDNSYFHSLEDYLAFYHKGESCLLFNSGFVANLAVFATIPQRGDVVFYDELIHACVKDGLRLGLAKHFSFRHNDLAHLEEKIKTSTGNQIFIALESVYSMDGDECLLNQFVVLAERYGAKIILDEAHTTGVCGEKGEGFAVQQNLSDQVFIRIHTFGKAIGAHGACVIASQLVKDYLINFSRQFIYTTSAPLHSLIAVKCAYEFLEQNTALITDLNSNIQLFKDLSNLETGSNSAIQPVLIAGNTFVKAVANTLQEHEFDVRPVLSPTVAIGAERLRICIHQNNTALEIKQLVSLLHILLKK